MVIRKTRIGDLEEVMNIYERAVHYMAKTGNPNQWTLGYPAREQVMADINRGVSYVMEENGVLEAVFAYIEGVDPTYTSIENGAWRCFGAYGTIHRLASAGRRKGIARACFAWCKQEAAAHGCVSLRADTHADNKIMQQALAQSEFLYCGIIHLANGAPRLAYECVLEPQKGTGIAFGVASMVLGIVSLLLFCTGVNFATGIAGIILGIVQITKHKEKSFAITGIVTAAISLLISIFLWITFAAGVADMQMEELYNGYYEEEYYDDYDSNEYYDEYYYEEGGAEFL